MGSRTYHQKWSHHPVHKYTEGNLLPHASLRKDLVQRFIANLAEDRIHHDQEANR